MEYCCHVQAGVPVCYLGLLDKLQKQICRTVDPLLTASLEPLVHCLNFSLSLLYRYYFGKFSSELAQLVPLPYSQGKSTCYSNRLHDCMTFTIPRCQKDVYVNNFFPCTARLWNSLPIELWNMIVTYFRNSDISFKNFGS